MQKYGIDSIPFMLLVDGSTGRVLATGQDLRQTSLDLTVARTLKAKKL